MQVIQQTETAFTSPSAAAATASTTYAKLEGLVKANIGKRVFGTILNRIDYVGDNNEYSLWFTDPAQAVQYGKLLSKQYPRKFGAKEINEAFSVFEPSIRQAVYSRLYPEPTPGTTDWPIEQEDQHWKDTTYVEYSVICENGEQKTFEAEDFEGYVDQHPELFAKKD